MIVYLSGSSVSPQCNQLEIHTSWRRLPAATAMKVALSVLISPVEISIAAAAVVVSHAIHNAVKQALPRTILGSAIVHMPMATSNTARCSGLHGILLRGLVAS
jgi:hypothetical protein